MIMKKHLKIFLSYLSLAALLLVSCSAEDKLGSETQGSQIRGIGSEDNIKRKNTNLPIWGTGYVPGNYKKELVGTWSDGGGRYDDYNIEIDGEGNLSLLINASGGTYTYTGKIADIFGYPYTVEIAATYISETKTGTITFDSASSSATGYFWHYQSMDWKYKTVSFHKIK